MSPAVLSVTFLPRCLGDCGRGFNIIPGNHSFFWDNFHQNNGKIFHTSIAFLLFPPQNLVFVWFGFRFASSSVRIIFLPFFEESISDGDGRPQRVLRGVPGGGGGILLPVHPRHSDLRPARALAQGVCLRAAQLCPRTIPATTPVPKFNYGVVFFMYA